MRRFLSIVLLLALPVVAVGCGASGGTTGAGASTTTATGTQSAATAAGTQSTTATTASPRSAGETCAPGARTLCVTAGDDGRTIDVRVGSTFTVELKSSGRTFSEPLESGAKVLELIGASRSGAAAEAYYRALAPGRARLRAVERPLCRRGRACPEYLLLWEVTILVKG